MSLIVKSERAVFDVSVIKCGALIYGKHSSWPEGTGGFILQVNEEEITVQHYAGVGKVTNHYRIPVNEAAAGEWELRWSDNLTNVETYVPENQEGQA